MNGTASGRVGLNAALLVISRVAGLALALVQTGLIFRGLTLEGQGQFGAALGFASFFTVFATLGIQRLLVREIARDGDRPWEAVWTALLVTGVLGSLCLGAIWLFQWGDPLQGPAFWAGCSVVFIWAIQQPFESMLIARERMGRVAAATFVTGVVKVALVACLLPGAGAATASGAHGILALANGLGFLLMAGVAVATCGWERPRVHPTAALAQARECLPFTVAMLLGWVYFKSDIVLLEWLRGAAAAGIYAPPQRLMEPLLMVASLWGTAVFPALCRLAHTDPGQLPSLRATSIRLAVLLSCPMALGLAVLARPVMYLLTGADPALDEYAMLLRVLCLVIPFFYFNSIAQEFLYAARRNWFVVGGLVLAAVVSVSGNLVAIPRWGAVGLAGVAVAANGMLTVVYGVGLRNELAGAMLGGLALRTALAGGVMAVAAWWASDWGLVAAILAGVVVYGMAHGVLGTLREEERGLVRHMLRRG